MLVDRHVLALFLCVCACPTSHLSVGFVDLHLVRTAWPDTRQDYHLFPFTSASLIVLLFSRWIGQPSIIWIRLLHFRLPRKTFLKLRGCCRLLFFCISFITLRRSPLVYFFFAPSSRSRDFCVISFKVLKEKHETRKLENINCGLDVMAVLRHTHDFHINCCRLFLKSN